MRVLMVLKRFHSAELFGGAEKSALRLAGALLESGVEVEIAGAALKHGWDRHETVKTGSGRIHVARLMHPRIRFVGTFVYNVQLLFKILAGRRTYDLVHVHFASFEMMTAAAARMLGGPPVLCKIACAGKTGEISIARKRFFFPLYRFLASRVDRWIALSSDIASELNASGIDGMKIARIPNGVDTNAYRPPGPEEKLSLRAVTGIRHDSTVLLFVGRLSRQKALDVLLEAVSRLRHLPLELLIAGKGTERNHLETLASELEIKRVVHFLGPVENVDELYRLSDIFILPSRDEGLSNALLEAMASGMKVISTNVSGSAEVITDGVSGRLVPPGDPFHIASAIVEAALDTGRMGEEARKRVLERYSIETVARSYLDIYADLSGAWN